MIYGMYHGMNVVVDREGTASAVLIRGLEPLSGIEEATDGPGKLCRALSIDRTLNGEDLVRGGDLYLMEDGTPPPPHLTSPRIGVDYAGACALKPWRFFVGGNRWVSSSRSRKTSR